MAKSARKIFFFVLWYVVNIVYNDTNKTVLRVLKLPWTVASLQLGIGLLYIVPLWLTGLRSPPKLSFADLKTMLVPSLTHAACQMLTVASLGAGSIAFVNAVKSVEPLSTALFGAWLCKDVLPWQVNACLLPIVAGVALASSATDMQFSWHCFVYALLSNVFSSLRAVLSKRAMAAFPPAKAMDAGNYFALLTTLAFLLTLPFALFLEGHHLSSEWQQALATGKHTANGLLFRVMASGVSFQLYNEASFHALRLVHPLTHSVGNNAKRPLIVLYSVTRLGTTVKAQTIGGSALAVSGLFLYALTKRLYAPDRPKID